VPGEESADSSDDATDAGTIAPPTEPEPADDPDSTLAAADTTPPSDEQLFAEEGWVPDDDPAVRVNEYVDFACRDTINNPGPPATVPDAAPPTSDAG
jgi:hypothetical protein